MLVSLTTYVTPPLTARETSRKPDEVYGVIERLAPHGRKLELFGRRHNVRPGWLTLGNQRRSLYCRKMTDLAVGESHVSEPDLHARLCERYPQQRFILDQQGQRPAETNV